MMTDGTRLRYRRCDARPTRIILVYSADVAVATYPGTVSPLRGLDPFGEAERDVWHGRETERDELAKMVTADGFRAGLLFGEPGVGKTSLVRAGLIPHLRDHGIVALACEDLDAAGRELRRRAVGVRDPAAPPTSCRSMFATRAVANAVAGQQFVFVVDDVDLLCADDRATAELVGSVRARGQPLGRPRAVPVRVRERADARARRARAAHRLAVPAVDALRAAAARRRRRGEQDPRSRAVAARASPPIRRSPTRSSQGIGRGQPVLPADLQIAGDGDARSQDHQRRRRSPKLGGADRARVGVAARRLQGDRQRALGAAAVRRARRRRPRRRGRPSRSCAGSTSTPAFAPAGVRRARAARRDHPRRRRTARPGCCATRC